MNDCFKSFFFFLFLLSLPLAAKILKFAAQEHYQYPQRKVMIFNNESHFQTTQSARDLHRGESQKLNK